MKIQWDKDDFQELVKLNMNHFRGNKNCGPWERLQQKFIELYGDEKAIDLFRRLYLRREEYEKLERYVVKWAKKYHPHYTKRSLETAIGMYSLQYAPCSFYQNPAWTKKGVLYIKRKESRK